MTNEQKQKITELRSSGISYAKIGKALGISGDTVKTYCHRNNVIVKKKVSTTDIVPTFCRECGALLTQAEKRKPRVFCSRACREKWWHSHPDKLNRKAIYDFCCVGCGKPFSTYGNKHRKYCSHACYISTRFKAGGIDE